MSLADAYATVIREEKSDIKRLIAFMKSRGHLSLLPQVVRILERDPIDESKPVALIAKEGDAKKFASEIREALSRLKVAGEPTISVDPRIVGGYTLRAGSQLVDRSFRSALISIYQKTIS